MKKNCSRIFTAKYLVILVSTMPGKNRTIAIQSSDLLLSAAKVTTRYQNEVATREGSLMGRLWPLGSWDDTTKNGIAALTKSLLSSRESKIFATSRR